MAMNLVILTIVLASFALGFRFADIRAEAVDRVRRRRLSGGDRLEYGADTLHTLAEKQRPVSG